MFDVDPNIDQSIMHVHQKREFNAIFRESRIKKEFKT